MARTGAVIHQKVKAMSFKVVCVAKLKPSKNAIPPFACPQIGDEYTVIRQVLGGDINLYELAEFPPTGYVEHAFDVRAFAPCTGPCEKEILEERLNQEIDHLDRVWEGIVKEMDKMENA